MPLIHIKTARLEYRFEISELSDIDTVIVEDKRSGYLFIKDMLSDCDADNIIVEPAYGDAEERVKDSNAGASKIAKSMAHYAENGRKNIFVVYDASAFGVYIDLVLNVMHRYKECFFYILDWDSFEYYILKSETYYQEIMAEDAGYQYESYERSCTYRLSELIDGYSKNSLHRYLKRSRCIDCKDAAGCSYRRYPYESLIYGGLKKLHDAVENKIDKEDGDLK